MLIDKEEFFAISMSVMGEVYPVRFHTRNYHDAIILAKLFCGRLPEKHLFIVSQDGAQLAYTRYRKYLKTKN